MTNDLALPPGAIRLKAVREALVAIGDAASDMRQALTLSNDPRHAEYFPPLLDLVELHVKAGLDDHLINVADNLVNLQSALRRQKVSARDEDLEARTESRKAVAGALGVLRTEIDNGLEALAEFGLRPSVPGLSMLIVTGPDVPVMLARLDERFRIVEDTVSDLRKAVIAADALPTNGVKQMGLVNFHIESMSNEVSAARFEANLASKNEIASGVDFNVLARAVTAMAKTAQDLKQNLKVVSEYFFETVNAASSAVVRAAKRAESGFKTVMKALRKTRPAAIDQGPAPPFDLAEAHAMILLGESPPDAWVPLIKDLNFNGEQALQSLAPLRGLTALQSLELRGTQVSDVTALRGLTALQSLILWDTEVSDVTALSGLTALQSLDLFGTQVSDVTALRGLMALQSLDLRGTQVSDVTALSGLTALQSLSLGYTQVSDVTALSGLTALQRLDLGYTQVSDVTALSGLTALQRLDLGYTQVSDVTALSGLTALQSLDLQYALVSDVTALSELTALLSLDLEGTQVSDVTALSGLTALRSLNLQGTQVSDVSVLDHLVAKGLKIEWNSPT